MIPFINASCINISRARKWFILDDNAIEDLMGLVLYYVITNTTGAKPVSGPNCMILYIVVSYSSDPKRT